MPIRVGRWHARRLFVAGFVILAVSPAFSVAQKAVLPPLTPDACDAHCAEAMSNHRNSREELLTLFTIAPSSDQAASLQRLNRFFGVSGPGEINQGNKEMASHLITKQECLKGLEGVVLQTPEQKSACGGAEMMVPIFDAAKHQAPKFCIDIFEFPNKPCELPVVWSPPTETAVICASQGKRLCDQNEWNLACRADPKGGPDWAYAYGNELDITICNTNKPHRRTNGRSCNARSARDAWNTCSTQSEPSGSFPKCRSRFGVYDQSGNVAEVMTRRDATSGKVSQLKGSAWFYKEVARAPGFPQTKPPRETYPDTCNYDPRWHVEPMSNAGHINYHLGFRCCKSIE